VGINLVNGDGEHDVISGVVFDDTQLELWLYIRGGRKVKLHIGMPNRHSEVPRVFTSIYTFGGTHVWLDYVNVDFQRGTKLSLDAVSKCGDSVLIFNVVVNALPGWFTVKGEMTVLTGTEITSYPVMVNEDLVEVFKVIDGGRCNSSAVTKLRDVIDLNEHPDYVHADMYARTVGTNICPLVVETMNTHVYMNANPLNSHDAIKLRPNLFERWYTLTDKNQQKIDIHHGERGLLLMAEALDALQVNINGDGVLADSGVIRWVSCNHTRELQRRVNECWCPVPPEHESSVTWAAELQQFTDAVKELANEDEGN